MIRDYRYAFQIWKLHECAYGEFDCELVNTLEDYLEEREEENCFE